MKQPKGTLLVIGGREDKGGTDELDAEFKNEEFRHFEVLKTFLGTIESSEPRIEIVTTASTIPAEMGDTYVEVFSKLGFHDVGVLDIRDRDDANSRKMIRKAEDSDAILFTGGDQFRLSTILGSTEFLKVIKDKYEREKFVIAGTSAGAMAMSTVMLYRGSQAEAMLKGNVMTSSGLGLLDYCIIDTHFIRRGRFARLAQAIVCNPSCIGIGLGEDTALVIRNGNEMECCGSGMVIIIDGADIRHTNITYTDDNTPVCVENLKVHVLANGNGYLLKERKFIPEKESEDVIEEQEPPKKEKAA